MIGPKQIYISDGAHYSDLHDCVAWTKMKILEESGLISLALPKIFVLSALPILSCQPLSTRKRRERMEGLAPGRNRNRVCKIQPPVRMDMRT